MALKSRTPLNTSALRRDFSALPQIAKIKADANMQMLNTIKSGLEKRKEKIEEKQKKELNIKLLKDIIEADTENRLVPPGVDAKELAKYIPLEETLRYRQTLDAINKEIQKERDRVKAGKSAAKAIGLPKRVGGLFPEAVVGGAIKDAITPVPSTPRPATSIQEYEFYKQSKEESGETPVGFKEFLESKSGPGTVINTGQGSLGRFSDKLSEAGAKEVFDSKKKAQDAINILRANQQNRELLNRGIIAGAAGAGFANELNKLLIVAGFDVDKNASANTDAYLANVAKQTATIIQDFGAGTGLSDADREFAARAAGGDIRMSEDALKKILSINDKAAVLTLKQHRDLIGKLPVGVSPYDLSVPLPVEFQEVYNTTLGEVEQSLEDFIKEIDDLTNRPIE